MTRDGFKILISITVFLLFSLVLIVCIKTPPKYFDTAKYCLSNDPTNSNKIIFTILDDNRDGVNYYRVWLFLTPEGAALGCQYEGETIDYYHPQAAEILRKTRTLPLRLELLPQGFKRKNDNKSPFKPNTT